jgi:AraC family transcriptional regulator
MPAGIGMDGHRHDQATIVILLSGDLCVADDGGEILESAGTIRLCPPGITQSIRTYGGADCLIVSCDPSHAAARHAIWHHIPRTHSTRYRTEAAAIAFVEDVRDSATRVLEFEIRCITLFTELMRHAEPSRVAPPWLETVLIALAKSEGRRGACRALAREIGIHPVHLGRIVRRFTGLTLREHFRRERIIRATGALRSSDHSLSHVAHEAGFADHSHFTREFVRRHGRAPSHDRLAGQSDVIQDVASIQAPEFPAVHLGAVTSR